jgi:histidine ammonia-lyase
MESHKNCDRVQDSYSLRCIPQVHGAIKDTFNYVKNIIEIEINSVTDNPLIFPEQDEVISGGNFHGEPIALAMDFLGIALAELANISDRRLFKLLAGQNGEDLPPFLLPKEKGGLNSGYMITQYTTAALVAENKVLSHPASVDSIPTCANQEDHVSFGMTAALKTQKIINNTEHVLNIELMVAAQALDFKKPLKPGRGSEIARDEVRRAIPFLATDRMLYLDLEKIEKIFCQVIKKVEQAIGPLNL